MVVTSWLAVAVSAFVLIGISAAVGTALIWFLRSDGGIFLATMTWGLLTSVLWVAIVVDTEPALSSLVPFGFSVHLLACGIIVGSLASFGATHGGDGGALGFTGLGAVFVVCLHLYAFPLLAGWLIEAPLFVI